MSLGLKIGLTKVNSMFSTGTTNLNGGRSSATLSEDVKARKRSALEAAQEEIGGGEALGHARARRSSPLH